MKRIKRLLVYAAVSACVLTLVAGLTCLGRSYVVSERIAVGRPHLGYLFVFSQDQRIGLTIYIRHPEALSTRYESWSPRTGRFLLPTFAGLAYERRHKDWAPGVPRSHEFYLSATCWWLILPPAAFLLALLGWRHRVRRRPSDAAFDVITNT